MYKRQHQKSEKVHTRSKLPEAELVQVKRKLKRQCGKEAGTPKPKDYRTQQPNERTEEGVT